MPAGVSWGQYLTFTAAAMISMLTGSQVVHQYYRPLQDLHNYINEELNNFPDHVQSKIRKELKDEGVLK
ncbi:ubiquinol-cytochrome-c reductase complex assembly factor 6 [Amyelois transitella]|uniref:ubiquinol-cytochrome-c reductase complex assembly factor 6 n=1 Tax=Amyelois transitella TaxID=680683 RepID=UPI00298F8788|nr:ubiquinol-cytochrome-c reductase complex assembly factor 6 [Amyelois transitella]